MAIEMGGSRIKRAPGASQAWVGVRPVLLPSRARALQQCRDALKPGRGLLVLTGEAGIGKTWLWKTLAAEPIRGATWVGIDLAPGTGSQGLIRQIGHALGRPDLLQAVEPRRALADELAERAEDGRRWILVVDEAHNASDEVLEELRLLSNALGRPDGFEGMLLSGLTGLARRLRSRAFDALNARVSAHVHLRPIDVEEARALLGDWAPWRGWTCSEVEALHRDARGNPGRLWRLACWEEETSAPKAPAPSLAPLTERPSGQSPLRPERDSHRIEPKHSPAIRQPIRDEEGLIEVGWPSDSEREQSLDLEDRSAQSPALAPTSKESPCSLEAVHDHYATLQAWNEWASNHARSPASMAPEGESARDPRVPLAASDEESVAIEQPGGGLGPRLRAEGHHDFAPYSQLFSRLRSATDSE